MGAVARRIDAEPFARRSTHLRLVTTPPAPATRPSRESASTRARARAAEARAKTAFVAFLTVFGFAVILGGARVTLLVRAAEASITESKVQTAIKAQRVEVERLEADKSALSTPSRIAGIASSTMGMGEPASVKYVSLPAPGALSRTDAATGVSPGGSASTDVFGNIVDALVELSAGEAQSLLVGDLGLAGSR
jgi:cell division protein FtsL